MTLQSFLTKGDDGKGRESKIYKRYLLFFSFFFSLFRICLSSCGFFFFFFLLQSVSRERRALGFPEICTYHFPEETPYGASHHQFSISPHVAHSPPSWEASCVIRLPACLVVKMSGMLAGRHKRINGT